MSKPKAQKLYVTKLIVRGSGQIPLDMLRYDSCSPWDTQDAHTMTLGCASVTQCITLRRVSPNASGPTEGRWRSFGWEVVEWTHLNEWSL